MILDIWSATPKHVDIRLPRTSVKGFLSLLPAHITQHEPIITNLRAAVAYTYPSSLIPLPQLQHLLPLSEQSDRSRQKALDVHLLNDIFFTHYQNYETIEQWMYLLASLRPELVKVVEIGKTFENQTIRGIVIHGKAKKGKEEAHKGEEVQGMLLQGAQHAREWISVSTVCYIAYQLVSGYYNDNTVRKLVDEFEWK
jgi:extracellular matrix protein 14